MKFEEKYFFSKCCTKTNFNWKTDFENVWRRMGLGCQKRQHSLRARGPEPEQVQLLRQQGQPDGGLLLHEPVRRDPSELGLQRDRVRCPLHSLRHTQKDCWKLRSSGKTSFRLKSTVKSNSFKTFLIEDLFQLGMDMYSVVLNKLFS